MEDQEPDARSAHNWVNQPRLEPNPVLKEIHVRAFRRSLCTFSIENKKWPLTNAGWPKMLEFRTATTARTHLGHAAASGGDVYSQNAPISRCVIARIHLTHIIHKYLLCDSTYLLEHAVRLHLLTGVILWLLTRVTTWRWSLEVTGLITDNREVIVDQANVNSSKTWRVNVPECLS